MSWCRRPPKNRTAQASRIERRAASPVNREKPPARRATATSAGRQRQTRGSRHEAVATAAPSQAQLLPRHRRRPRRTRHWRRRHRRSSRRRCPKRPRRRARSQRPRARQQHLLRPIRRPRARPRPRPRPRRQPQPRRRFRGPSPEATTHAVPAGGRPAGRSDLIQPLERPVQVVARPVEPVQRGLASGSMSIETMVSGRK
jgi:hypothetical protein